MKYIRKVDSIGRWDGTKEPLYDGAFSTGDILLSELKTANNTLSIWAYSNDNERDEVLAAIALTRQHIDRLAYVIMDENEIRRLGIPLTPEKGLSDGIVREEILERHANLDKIDFWRLGYVAEYITKLAQKQEEHSQLSDKKVYKLIERLIAQNDIDYTQINEQLRASLDRARIKYGKVV